jgi:predicted ATP-dependent endonuclease of OLD family
VDVVNVRGLSFKRFVDITKMLKKQVVIVTDNDGDYQRHVVDKYRDYDPCSVKICADRDNSADTLEPQIVKCNKLTTLNEIFGTQFGDDRPSLIKYMKANKTDCALRIFETTNVDVRIPQYVQDAVE